ncbi:MAG: restriction endonuclease subunit S [Nitrospirota bacterium]
MCLYSKTLKNIAEVQIGCQFRKRLESTRDGTYQVIQIRDIRENHNICVKDLCKVTPDHSVKRYLVTKGDILFLARGHRNFAVLIEDYLVNTIAASYFLILRLKTKDILPAYLAWFINQSPAQEYLQRLARRGSHIPIVPKSVFKNLKVDIPELDTQEKIVELNRLFEKKSYLLKNLMEKYSLLISSVSLKAARRDLKKKKKNEC